MPDIADQLADRIVQASTIAGVTEPRVRGADWRPAVVTAVNSNGTVNCGDIVARRRVSYVLPQVGDRIILMRSGTGNWLASGLLATSGTGGWVTLTLASGYTTGGGGADPAYLLEGRRVTLRGRLGPTSGTLPNATTFATLPATIRPPHPVGWSSPRNGSTAAPIRCEIEPGGVLRIYDTGGPTWISLDGVSYYTI